MSHVEPTDLLIIEGTTPQSAESASYGTFRTTYRGFLSVEQPGDYRYGYSLPHLRPKVPYDKSEPATPWAAYHREELKRLARESFGLNPGGNR